MAQYVLSSKQIKVVWGTHRLWDDTDIDSGVQITADYPVWRLVPGCDGEMVRVRRTNFPGRVVVNLSQHTPANRDMLVRLIADAQTGVVVAPLLVADLQGIVKFASPLAYIEGLPQHGYAGTPSVASWVFVCPILVPAVLPSLSPFT